MFLPRDIVPHFKETSTMIIIDLSIFKDVGYPSSSISNEIAYAYKKSTIKDKLPKFWSNKCDHSQKLTYKIGKFCFDKLKFETELSEILMQYNF